MSLNAPRVLFFIISVVIAILAVISFAFNAFVIINAFWLLAIAYVILALACIIKGA
jgi:hypothetical protein